jgi:hypothetical protein
LQLGFAAVQKGSRAWEPVFRVEAGVQVSVSVFRVLAEEQEQEQLIVLGWAPKELGVPIAVAQAW